MSRAAAPSQGGVELGKEAAGGGVWWRRTVLAQQGRIWAGAWQGSGRAVLLRARKERRPKGGWKEGGSCHTAVCQGVCVCASSGVRAALEPSRALKSARSVLGKSALRGLSLFCSKWLRPSGLLP